MMTVAVTSGTWLEQAPLLVRDALTGLLPESLRGYANSLVVIISILATFCLLIAYLTLAERKILRRIQNRPGPNRTGFFGLLQPFADSVKALTKEDVVPRVANHLLHFIAPVALVALSLHRFAVIP